MTLHNIITVYLIIVNLTSFVMFAVDKYKAIHKQRRIPEKRLLLSAVIGGSVGALLGMLVCCHKTKHLKFILGVPAILIIHLALAFYLVTNC